MRDKVHRGEEALRWGRQFRFFREEVLSSMTRYRSGLNGTGERIDYERWYPEVPAVMDTRQLADLLHTNEQIIRARVREGILPGHRQPGGRKFTFLRHEVFDWLISNRYQPEPGSMDEASS